LVHIATVF